MAKKLTKDLGLIAATSIVTGCVIGSGVFVKPGRVLLATGSSSLALLAWVIGALITIAGGLTIAEISTRIPKTGGIYVYVEEIYGKTFGFLCGWVLTFVYGPALASALSLYFGSLFTGCFGLPTETSITVAIIAIVLLSSLCVIGTRFVSLLQTVSTVAKLIPIFVIGLAGIWMGDQHILGQTSGLSTTEATGMGAAILSTLWAYDGWLQVGAMAGEMRNPSKDLPKAIIFGLSLVAICYLLVNISIFHILPAADVAQLNEKAAIVASEKIFGHVGATLIHLGILISIFGCLNGNLLSSTRVPYAMGERRELPFSSWISRTHPRFGTPQNAIILQTCMALLMISTGKPDLITDIGISAIYVFYVFVFAGIARVRKKKIGEGLSTYRIPFYPFVPFVAAIGGFYIVVSTVQNQPRYALTALVITLAGLPVHWWVQKRARHENEKIDPLN